LDPTDDRVQWAVLVVRRTNKMYRRRVADLLFECDDKPRFADTGLAGQKNNSSFSGLGLAPSALQQFELFQTIHEGQVTSAQGLESAIDRSGAENREGADRRRAALQAGRTENLIAEQFAGKTTRRFGDSHHGGVGQGYETGGKIGRISDDR